MTGRVMFTLLFNPDGSQYEDPTGTRNSPNIGSNGLSGPQGDIETCMIEALKGVRSKPLGDGNTAAVTYPVIFSPG